MAAAIPESHRDLLDRPIIIALVTVMPDGTPQATPVWVDYDGQYLLINSKRGRQKDKNMTVGAKVTVLSIDPDKTSRWLEVRGQVAAVTEEGGVEHANKLSMKYDNEPDFFAPYPHRRGETRVIYKIEPLKVNVDG